MFDDFYSFHRKSKKNFRWKFQIPKKIQLRRSILFRFQIIFASYFGKYRTPKFEFFESYRITLIWKWNEELSLEMFKLVEQDRETTISLFNVNQP